MWLSIAHNVVCSLLSTVVLNLWQGIPTCLPGATLVFGNAIGDDSIAIGLYKRGRTQTRSFIVHVCIY